MRRHAASWLTYATVSALGTGINILVHADDPHEILQFLGGWLVTSGLAGLAIMLVMMFRAPKT